jgi:hypothetical protein
MVMKKHQPITSIPDCDGSYGVSYMTTETLMNTTAHVSANAYADIPAIADGLAVGHKAFEQKNDADKLNGKAVQGMAYACMVLWFNWQQTDNEANGGSPLPSLVDCIHANQKDARSQLKEWFVLALVGADESSLYKGEGTAAELRSAYERERSNKVMLVSRGMNMAAILLASGITCGMFNKAMYAFAVKPSMLYEKGQIPLGRLQDEANPILLNRRQYAVTNDKSAFIKITASVDQLNKAQRVNMKLKVSKAAKGGLKLEEVSDVQLATTCSIGTLLAALHKAITIREKDAAHPIVPDMFTPTQWGMLTDIAFFNDTTQERDDVKAYKRNGITADVVVMPADTRAVS